MHFDRPEDRNASRMGLAATSLAHLTPPYEDMLFDNDGFVW